MKLFKLIASRGGTIIFDQRLEAQTPREARELMRTRLGLESLTGIVYAITEIPVEIITEIVQAAIAKTITHGHGRGGSARVDIPSLVQTLLDSAVDARLRDVENRLKSMEDRLRSTASSVGGVAHHNPPAGRFDAFSSIPTRSPAASTGQPATARVASIPASEGTSDSDSPAAEQVDWAAVRRFYKRTGSPKQTAAHFDLSINTVKARIRREGWK